MILVGVAFIFLAVYALVDWAFGPVIARWLGLSEAHRDAKRREREVRWWHE